MRLNSLFSMISAFLLSTTDFNVMSGYHISVLSLGTFECEEGKISLEHNSMKAIGHKNKLRFRCGCS